MKIITSFRSLSRSKQISLSVLFFHLIILLGLVTHHFFSYKKPPSRPIIVKTISFAPPEKPKNLPVVVKSTPKSIGKPSKPVLQTKPLSAKTTLDPTQTKTMNEITKSIEAISTPSAKTKTNVSVPVKKEIVKIEEDPNYGEYLIAYLQNQLKLPEFGEVRLEIEIDRSGRLIQSQILQSKSDKNAAFLKKELHLLSYPIPHLGPKETSKKFTISFKNM